MKTLCDKNVYYNIKIIIFKSGYKPKISDFTNSGYMADYLDPLIAQIKAWQVSDSVVNHSQQPEHEKALGKHRLRFKTTIEPTYELFT